MSLLSIRMLFRDAGVVSGAAVSNWSFWSSIETTIGMYSLVAGSLALIAITASWR